ncbi:SIMPL domain-containing protein [Patescibacteria group bacterium]|nr:MAG: SIMPL domain-containing protein [Patescibacteria group bacterium]
MFFKKGGMKNGSSEFHSWCAPLYVLAGFLLLALVFFVSVKTNQAYEETKRIGRADVPQPTIAINGEGRVTAVPDVARISVGLITEGRDIATIQRQNTEKMNNLIAAVKTLGVADKDIQTTNYSIYPKYDYTDGRSILSGYTVNQNATVKVRDLSKVGAIFAKVGEIGANQVSGPDFTIDDPTALRDQARLDAIADAQMKAEALARSLGVRLGRVVGFSESGSGAPVPFYDLARGLGGAESAPPKIEAGELDITSDVSLVFEIL